MWYYLTQNESFPDVLTEVRSPEMAFQESSEPRLCIAPTVSQCILATASLEGMFEVLVLKVNDPEPADDSVTDRLTTNEHWITQRVLDRNGGSIAVHRHGRITIEPDMRTSLKVALLRMVPAGWEHNESRLYRLVSGVWIPQFVGPSHVADLLR